MTRTRSASEKLGRTAAVILMFILGAAINLLTAFLVMLALGVAHDQWPAVPAFGYWATYLLVIGIASFAGAIHGGMRVKWDDK